MSTVRATATRTVPASPEVVWAVLSDHEGMSSWGPGIVATLDTPGEQDRNGVGAVRRVATRLPGADIVERITAFVPPSRLEYRAVSGIPLRNYGGEVVLTPSGSGTRVDYTIFLEPRVPVVEAAVARAVAAGIVTALARAVRRTT